MTWFGVVRQWLPKRVGKLAYYIANLFCEVSLATLSSWNAGTNVMQKSGVGVRDLHLYFYHKGAE